MVSPRDLVSPPDTLSLTGLLSTGDLGLSCPEAVCSRNAERPLFMSLSPHRRAPDRPEGCTDARRERPVNEWWPITVRDARLAAR